MNEFASGKYDQIDEASGLTRGELILTRYGFVDRNGEAYSYEWAWWALLYCLAICLFSVVVSSVTLVAIRFATGQSLATDSGEEEETEPPEQVDLPFQKVDLTFRDIRYTVKASVGNEKIMLLKGIDGIVESGQMTALMGSS